MNMTPATTALPWQPIYDELGIVVPDIDHRPLGFFVEQHAAKLPDAIALQYFDREITYFELNELANRFANALVSLGVVKGDVVGIHLPNIPQYAIALVACAKIGCAGSGVSPLMTPSEISHQLEDAGISVLLSLDTLIQASIGGIKELPTCLQHIIAAAASDYIAPGAQLEFNIPGLKSYHYLSLVENASPSYTQQAVQASDVMMVQYTGGTTGRPKGAELSIRCLMYNSQQASAYAPWEIGTEVVATAFPMFHAAGLAFTISALRFAARMFLIPDPRDIKHFCQQMQRFPPTRIAAVPSLYQMLLDCPDIAGVNFNFLKVANSGAAPLTGADREKIEQVIGRNKLSDVFGMTETGPVHVCSPPTRAKPGSVGIPVPGADTRIIDLETGTREMPTGEAGEIITRGPQLMNGYRNLPDESAKAMRQWQGKTWMYTGDVGYADEEGYIYLCDRAKDMLIVGGYKVFSIELEDKLKTLDYIASTAVIGTADEKRPGNDIVNLYVELAATAKNRTPEIVSEEILAFCRENMAPYKVPKAIHIIERIPLTSVGKVDKKALRQTAGA